MNHTPLSESQKQLVNLRLEKRRLKEQIIDNGETAERTALLKSLERQIAEANS